MTEPYLPDIPRIYTGIAEWCACLGVLFFLIKNWGCRLSRVKTVCVVIFFFVVQNAFLVMTDSVPVFWWIPCMLAAICLMFAYIFTLSKVTARSACYFTLMAFVLAEFMASLVWQVECYLGKGNPKSLDVWAYLLMVFVYATIVIVVMAGSYRDLKFKSPIVISKKELAFGMVIGLMAFVISNISFIFPRTVLSIDDSVGAFILRTFVDMCGVAIFVGHFIMCCDWRLVKEYDSMQNVLKNQYIQYQLSKESIEMINMKYHDLKHQIQLLQSGETKENDSFLRELQFEIRQYEAQNKTGNAVLDTILTGKSLACANKKIQFTSVANGEALSFMTTSDICNIFGNALDNAIEYEEKLEEIEKRMIHLSVSRQMGFLVILCENYVEDEIDVSEMKTTKKNREFHGYGLKSIRYTAEKYGGAVEAVSKGHWFELKILIPVKKHKM